MIVLATILVVVSVLVVVGMFFVKLAQVGNRTIFRVAGGSSSFHQHVWPYLRKQMGIAAKAVWHFILEAKDLKPATTKTIQHQVERVKNAFRIRIRTSESDPHWLPEATELTAHPQPNQNPEDLYLEAIKKNPNDHQAYEALGRLYLQNKNFVDAAEIYEYLIKLDPMRDIYFSNLGLAYYSLKDFAKAATTYEKALSMNNKIPTRWINLSLCFDALADYPKTVKALTQALVIDKLNLNYQMMLADAYLKIPNSIRAEEVLEQILTHDPTNRVAREKLMKLKI